MPDKSGCNDAFHYFRGEREIWDWSVRCQMIRVQSTFLQPRKYDGLLLTVWKTAERRVALHKLQMTGIRIWMAYLKRILATSEQLTREMLQRLLVGRNWMSGAVAVDAASECPRLSSRNKWQSHLPCEWKRRSLQVAIACCWPSTTMLGRHVRILYSRSPVLSVFGLEQWALTVQLSTPSAPPTNHSSSQKTRLNDLSHGIKIWTDCSYVLSQSTCLTDRQTEFSSLDCICIPRSEVKMKNWPKKDETLVTWPTFQIFGAKLISLEWLKIRTSNFACGLTISVYISSNDVLRMVFSCFANSQDFNQLCYSYGVSVICMNFSEITCAVYDHFMTSSMWFLYIEFITVLLWYQF